MSDMLESPAPLSGADAEELVATVTEAMQIRRRYQFFVWTQGRLRNLLPHGLLLCGMPRAGSGRMFFDYFYNVPIEPDTLARLCHPRDGLARELVNLWLAGGGEPLCISPGHAASGHEAIAAELQRLQLTDVVAHGIPSAQPTLGAHGFFGFVALPQHAGEREITLCHLLVPHIFGAYCRALSREGSPGTAADEHDGELPVTEREVEILRWVREGKSNQEIGNELGISPLTVKNHVQKILRKLGASNRAQAVSIAISSGLLANASAGA